MFDLDLSRVTDKQNMFPCRSCFIACFQDRTHSSGSFNIAFAVVHLETFFGKLAPDKVF